MAGIQYSLLFNNATSLTLSSAHYSTGYSRVITYIASSSLHIHSTLLRLWRTDTHLGIISPLLETGILCDLTASPEAETVTLPANWSSYTLLFA